MYLMIGILISICWLIRNGWRDVIYMPCTLGILYVLLVWQNVMFYKADVFCEGMEGLIWNWLTPTKTKKGVRIFGWNWSKVRPNMDDFLRHNYLLPFFNFTSLAIWPLFCKVYKENMVQRCRVLQVHLYETGAK